MKKIKKFRVQPRPSAVLRNLKALLGDAQTTPELEKAVESEIKKAAEFYSTAALYDTFGPAESPAWAAGLWDAANESGAKPVAVTFYTATIGPALEGELGDALTRGEGLRSQILTSVGEEAAEQAAQFVYRLISEEAKEESCGLSERVAPPPELRREILALLEADKVQIQMDGMGHLSPRFTRAGHVLWWPPAKRRR